MSGLVLTILVIRFWRVGVVLVGALRAAWILDATGLPFGESLIVIGWWVGRSHRRRTVNLGRRR